MASKKHKQIQEPRLSVAKALLELERLKQVSSSSDAEALNTGDIAFAGKVKPGSADQLSNEEERPNVAIGTGVSTQPQSEVMKAIEAGDKDVQLKVREELIETKSKVGTSATTIALTISLGAAAIIMTVVLYLHSDLRTEQKALESRLMSIVYSIQEDISRIMKAIGDKRNQEGEAPKDKSN